jgi:hypothetical protein
MGGAVYQAGWRGDAKAMVAVVMQEGTDIRPSLIGSNGAHQGGTIPQFDVQ